MKTDTIFYSLFKEFPSIFFELINQSPEEAKAYEFTSREVKQLAFRLDGLFLPTNNNPEKPFYVVEVQFQPDEDLYYRLFAELFLYLRQYQPSHPWEVVVIYPSRSIEREKNLHFGKLLSLAEVKRVYLDELAQSTECSLGVGVVKLVMESEETAGIAAKRLIEQAKQQLTDAATQRDLIQLIETIIVYKLPKKSRKEIEAMLGLSELKQTKVYQEAKEEGFQEGEQIAKFTTVPRMLQFGLNLDAISQLIDLPRAVIQQAAKSFHQQNVTALIELLKNQPSLFTPETLAELVQLIEPLPDNIEELSQAISNWCKAEERSQILDTLNQIRQTLLSSTTPGSNTETPDKQLNKIILQNALRDCQSHHNHQ